MSGTTTNPIPDLPLDPGQGRPAWDRPCFGDPANNVPVWKPSIPDTPGYMLDVMREGQTTFDLDAYAQALTLYGPEPVDVAEAFCMGAQWALTHTHLRPDEARQAREEGADPSQIERALRVVNNIRHTK